MRSRSMLIGGLLGMAMFAVPAHAGAVQPAPPRLGYRFAHGAVTHFRQWALATDITSEDMANPYENGSFKVGFQARMPQYVIQSFPDGSGIINTTFDQINTRVNGQDVMHAIPDPYDAKGNPHYYYLLVHPDGTCDCSKLPDPIYDVSGGYPHALPLGDLVQYLHPSLPAAKMRLGATWTTALPLAFAPKGRVLLVSRLQDTKGDWSVMSSVYQRFSVTITPQEYLALHPHDTLGSNAPITVTGYLKVTSKLSLLAADGVKVVPLNATKNTQPTLCAACTGYPLPLEGEDHLHVLYTQNGSELALTDIDARLTIGNSLG